MRPKVTGQFGKNREDSDRKTRSHVKLARQLFFRNEFAQSKWLQKSVLIEVFAPVPTAAHLLCSHCIERINHKGHSP